MTEAAETAVGSADAFPVGQMRVVRAATLEIGIVRQPDGRFYAIRNRCPHRGAPICLGSLGGTMLPSAPGELAYGLEESVVRCPWHGYEFDLASGQGLFSSAAFRLRTYPVIVRDGTVYLTGLPSAMRASAELEDEQQ